MFHRRHGYSVTWLLGCACDGFPGRVANDKAIAITYKLRTNIPQKSSNSHNNKHFTQALSFLIRLLFHMWNTPMYSRVGHLQPYIIIHATFKQLQFTLHSFGWAITSNKCRVGDSQSNIKLNCVYNHKSCKLKYREQTPPPLPTELLYGNKFL